MCLDLISTELNFFANLSLVKSKFNITWFMFNVFIEMKLGWMILITNTFKCVIIGHGFYNVILLVLFILLFFKYIWIDNIWKKDSCYYYKLKIIRLQKMLKYIIKNITFELELTIQNI